MHTATLHSYFYDHYEAMRYAIAMAHYERKRYRVERRERNTLFRFEVVRTDIDIDIASDKLAA